MVPGHLKKFPVTDWCMMITELNLHMTMSHLQYKSLFNSHINHQQPKLRIQNRFLQCMPAAVPRFIHTRQKYKSNQTYPTFKPNYDQERKPVQASTMGDVTNPTASFRSAFLTALSEAQRRLQLGIVSKITRQGGMQSISSCEIPSQDIVLADSHFAEGGFGMVYDCTLKGASVRTVKDVTGSLVCKCVPVDLQDCDALQMICRELLLLFEFGTAAFHRASSFLHAWSLRLPGNPCINGANNDSCCLMLVMSKAAGSLDQLARRGGLGYDDCVGVFFRVAEALAYVHAAGTLHHDLHAGNVLVFQLQRNGRDYWAPVLADYGIDSRVVHDSIAPPEATAAMEEELELAAMRRPASDVYRLGLMMRQVLHLVAPRSDPGPDLLEALTVMEITVSSMDDNEDIAPSVGPSTRVVPDMPPYMLAAILASPTPLAALLGIMAGACMNVAPESRPTAAQVRDILRAADASLRDSACGSRGQEIRARVARGEERVVSETDI